MKRFFLMLALFSVSAYAGRLPEIRKRYLVKEVKGYVLAWPPLSPAWTELKTGDAIWESTLIQVSKDASITFELSMKEGFTGIQAESMIITLNSPILMRLRENIPRRLTLNDYFIPKIPEPKPAKDVMELMYESFGEAWERFAANLLKEDIKADFMKGLKEEDKGNQDSAVSMRSKKIRIYTPAANALSIVPSLPQEMRVTWKAVTEKGVNYGVRIWQPDKPRPEPMAYTTQDFYSVKIEREGKYLAQIVSEDGRWQSEVRQFNMVLPMSGRGEPPSLTHVNLPLPLLLPPRNFAFYSQEIPISVAFEWERPNAAVGHQVYTFVLSDANGKELYRKDTSDMSFNLKFTNPGSYRWFVAATPTTSDESLPPRIFSEVRTISIQPPVTFEANKPDPIESLLSINQNRVYYLEKLW